MTLLGSSRDALRHLSSLIFGPPKPAPNQDQKARLTIYPPEGRRVRAVPSRRPTKRKAA